MKRKLTGLLIWLVLAYVLCLIPSSSFDWIKALIRLDSEGQSTGLSTDPFEWAAHAMLMAGVAFCLVRLLRRKREVPEPEDRDHRSEDSGRKADLNTAVKEPKDQSLRSKDFCSMLLTLLLVLLIAISIEVFQAMLPESFHRGPSWSDVWFSLLGGLIGGFVATVLGFKR